MDLRASWCAPGQNVLGDILCFLLHEYFQLWVSLQHILIGLIISSSVVFGRLGVYNPSFLEMVGLGVSGLFDWVSKVLKCQQFTIKKCWDGGVPFFFSLGAICYFTYSWVVYGFLLDLSDQRQEKLFIGFLVGISRITLPVICNEIIF